MPLKCSFCGNEAKYALGLYQYCCKKIPSECPANIDRFYEETQKMQIAENGIPLEVVNVAGFRSNPELNTKNDMVQVTLKMKKDDWYTLQKFLKHQSEII